MGGKGLRPTKPNGNPDSKDGLGAHAIPLFQFLDSSSFIGHKIFQVLPHLYNTE